MFKKKVCLLLLVYSCISSSVLAGTILNATSIKQLPELPTGCEATALTMLINYNNINVSKTEVAKAMPKSSAPYLSNGKYVAAHPNDYFIGNPFSANSYGAYAPVIAKTLNNYLPGRAINLTNKSFDAILEYIDAGQPVVMWVTIDMRNTYKGRTWQTPYGSFTWTAPQHAVLMTGYDNEYIYYNDPTTGTNRKTSKEVFINRWASLGKQAVTVSIKSSIYNITLDGKDLGLNVNTKSIKYGQEYWVPARTLNILNPDFSAAYKDGISYLVYKGEYTPLKQKYLPGIKVKQLNGSNYINLEWVTYTLGFDYEIGTNIIRFTSNK